MIQLVTSRHCQFAALLTELRDAATASTGAGALIIKGTCSASVVHCLQHHHLTLTARLL
jgi:hypothetical protein